MRKIYEQLLTEKKKPNIRNVNTKYDDGKEEKKTIFFLPII